jgi:ankyrin repeat protein
MTSLSDAVKANDLERVKTLIASGVDVTAKDENGWTLLNDAAFYTNNPALVHALLRAPHGIQRLNSRNGVGSTPLMTAVQYAHPLVVKALLEYDGIDVTVVNDGLTALDMARGRQHVECVRLLVEYPGVYPLIKATRANDLEKVKTLIDNGADVTVATPSGWIALHVAVCFTNNPALVHVLLRAPRGMECLNSRDRLGSTALMLAVLNNKTLVVKALLEYDDIDLTLVNEGHTALGMAKSRRAVECIRMLVMKKYPGNYSLFKAIMANDLESVKTLIDIGVGVKAKTSMGWVALHIAAQSTNNPALVRALLLAPRGMECLNSRNGVGSTALMLAVLSDNTLVVKALLEYDDIDVTVIKEGHTALDMAREHQHVECIRLLEEFNVKKRKLDTHLGKRVSDGVPKKRGKISYDTHCAVCAGALNNNWYRKLKTIVEDEILEVNGGIPKEKGEVIRWPRCHHPIHRGCALNLRKFECPICREPSTKVEIEKAKAVRAKMEGVNKNGELGGLFDGFFKDFDVNLKF